jgi:hypothetical protein
MAVGGARTPAWIVLAAVALTAGIEGHAVNLVLRNLALVVAALDACAILVLLLRAPVPQTDSGAAGSARPATG